MKKTSVSLFFAFVLLVSLTAQDALVSGLDAYAKSDWSTAILSFRKALSSSDEKNRPETWFWLIMSELSSGDYETAMSEMERFTARYPADARNADLSYQKGRIKYTEGKYEESIQVLYRYLSEWPSHASISSAYYWIGECLYSTGRYEEASSVFRLVVERFPESVKGEAARYRLALIGQTVREDELLRLLKQSHEESLKIIEEYQRREKTYEQAMTAYQKRISEMIKDTRLGDLEKQLGDEKLRNSRLTDRIAVLESQNAELAAALTMTGAAPAAFPNSGKSGEERDSVERKRALEELRTKALTLENIYSDAPVEVSP